MTNGNGGLTPDPHRQPSYSEATRQSEPLLAEPARPLPLVPSRPGALPGRPGVRRLRRTKSSTLLSYSSPVRTRYQQPGRTRTVHRLQIFMPADLADEIVSVAMAEGRSRSAVAKALLELGLWAYEKLSSLQPTEEDLSSAIAKDTRNDYQTSQRPDSH